MNNSNRTKTDRSTMNLAQRILEARYLLKDSNGRVIETPEQLYHRVAMAVASAEYNYDWDQTCVEALARKFQEMMSTGIFLPNSPTLMNAGREQGVLSGCFVLPIEDSIDAIFDTVKNTALIQKAGGGTGFCFDRLRPTGDIVASSGGRTSGPISFWRVIAETTNAIQQGAFRRGANMGMMSLDHPDILKFIHAKQDPTAFTNFNISVKITDAFMKRLQEQPTAPHVVVNPRNKMRYLLPRTVDMSSYTIDDLVPAEQPSAGCCTIADMWDMIVKNADATGEPGVCFIDRVNETNPTPHLGPIEATNPCGEQPLLPYECCNLGSLDISKFVSKDETGINWDALVKTIQFAVRFLDNVIDVNYYPVPQIKEITLANRKIGLGIMGFADTLLLLGIRYDSEEAVEFAGKLSRFVREHAHRASEKLAGVRGVFPNWQQSTWKDHRPMRNAAVTTIAPTGTISLIAGCSSGIEPIFSTAGKRKALDGQEFVHVHPLVERLGNEEGWLTDQVRDLLVQGIPPRDVPKIPRRLADALVTAHEIAPEWHVRVQAAFQEHTDNAVSKTVNLPSTATPADVDKIFRLAYEMGCKGITVYRDGCRQDQVLTSAARQRASLISPRPRPRKTEGQTFKYRMGCGTLFVTVNRDGSGLAEVFGNLGKAGGCPAQSEATCRAVSVALRSGVDPHVLVEQLKGIRCLSTIAARKTNGDVDVQSCPDAIARAIEESLGQNSTSPEASKNECPECGHPLRREAGCNVCDQCGFSKCG